MKSRISILKILVLVVFVFSIGLITSNVNAADNNYLIKVNGNAITETTTISQINSMFGEYKIETDSAFGGKMYSYYDDTYEWYLAIETDANGKIKGYGAIGGDFVAKRYAYGDLDNSSYWYLSGTIVKEWENDVYGIYEYNCTSTDVNNYWSAYQRQSDKYLYDLQKHSIAVSKVLAVREGYEFPQTYPSEDIFYINEQLKYNNSNYYDYANNTGRTRFLALTSERTDEFYNDLPNPIRLGRKTEGYEYASAYKYVLYDIEITDYTRYKGYTRTIYINPDFLLERKVVELLEDEKVKFQAAQEQYDLYVKHDSEIVNMYDEEPNYESLPLNAGKYNESVLQSVTAYINIARAGLGIQTLTINQEIADAAQHKAVLIRYMAGIGLATGHRPVQPDGVEDEFYNKAQSYMNENLYSGNILTSIVQALNDAYGSPIECGHRYNLLNPGVSQWGAGCADYQGVHKFGGSAVINTDLVAWPSNGIFPLDLAYRGIGNWTAHFYKNYTVSSATEVTVKCLNTDKVYKITNENKNDNGKVLKITGNYLVTFRDDNISYEDGDVFEITLHNVKNSSGETVDYTYRSVFKSFYQPTEGKVIDITLSQQNVSLTLGQSKRVYATAMPEDALNKLMKFESLNSDIVSVRQDGTITALNTGEAKIKVTCDGVEKTINIVVEKAQKGDLNMDGMIDSADAAIALNIFKYNNATQADLELGDMDGNGMIDSADAAMILNVFKYNM